jgi:hypothetical protein
MGTYDPATVLAAISANAAAVVAIGGVSILAMFVFFIEGARMGRRDRVYPMALWMTALLPLRHTFSGVGALLSPAG